MELREIEVFLTLAEELHFGRTAARLFVSQARVSQTIRALEREVGGELFARDSHSVRITALGTRLRERLRPAYEQITSAVADLRPDPSAVTGVLRVAVANFAAAGPSWSLIVRTFRQRHPACGVTVHEEYPGEGMNRLRGGELDLLVTWLPCRTLDVRLGPQLTTAPAAVALHATHPLATRDTVTVADLRGEHLLVAANDDPAALLGTATADGYPVTAVSARVIETLGMVAAGQGSYLTVATLPAYYTHPEVVVRPLTGAPERHSALATSSKRPLPAARAFAAVVTDLTTNPTTG